MPTPPSTISSRESIETRLAKADSAVESLTADVRKAQTVKKAAVFKLHEVIANAQRERDEHVRNIDELKVENGKLWEDIYKLEKMNTELCQIIDQSADSIDAEWKTSQRYLKECHRLRDQLIRSDTQNRSLQRALDRAGTPVVEVIEEEENTSIEAFHTNLD
jgi:chromosome segregation ATPase